MSSINLDLHSNKHIKNVFWTNCLIGALYTVSMFTPVLLVLYFFKFSMYYKYRDLLVFYPNDLKEYKVKPIIEEVPIPDPEMEYLKTLGITFNEDVVEQNDENIDDVEEVSDILEVDAESENMISDSVVEENSEINTETISEETLINS